MCTRVTTYLGFLLTRFFFLKKNGCSQFVWDKIDLGFSKICHEDLALDCIFFQTALYVGLGRFETFTWPWIKSKTRTVIIMVAALFVTLFLLRLVNAQYVTMDGWRNSYSLRNPSKLLLCLCGLKAQMCQACRKLCKCVFIFKRKWWPHLRTL